MHLGAAIPTVAERQNRVIVSMRYSVTVSVVPAGALHVGGDDALVSFLVMLLQPGKECRTKIKTYMRVVIDDLLCAPYNNPGRTIGFVALGINAFVPIVKRLRTWFRIDNSRPRILTRRLIKVSVNDKRCHVISV